MVVCSVVPVQPSKTLVDVDPELYYRGQFFIAEDRRLEYLIISQSIRGIQTAISELCNQEIGKSSLHESSRREHRKGITAGAWSVVKLEKDAAIKHWNANRGRYAKAAVGAWCPSHWKFE